MQYQYHKHISHFNNIVLQNIDTLQNTIASYCIPIRKLLGCNNLENTMDLQPFPPCNKVKMIKVSSSGYKASTCKIPIKALQFVSLIVW